MDAIGEISVVQNVRVRGRIELTGDPAEEHVLKNVEIQPGLRPRRPKWMPTAVADRLRGWVTEIDEPYLRIPLPDGEGEVASSTYWAGLD